MQRLSWQLPLHLQSNKSRLDFSFIDLIIMTFFLLLFQSSVCKLLCRKKKYLNAMKSINILSVDFISEFAGSFIVGRGRHSFFPLSLWFLFSFARNIDWKATNYHVQYIHKELDIFSITQYNIYYSHFILFVKYKV